MAFNSIKKQLFGGVSSNVNGVLEDNSFSANSVVEENSFFRMASGEESTRFRAQIEKFKSLDLLEAAYRQ
jgi:hypothetical protein